MSTSVYSVVTDRIIEQLEAGVIPWRRPWGGPGGHPRNAVSRKPYRGCNVFLLSAASYDQPHWLTFRQADLFGGHVKKGERGWPVVFWSIKDGEDAETGKRRKLFLLRYYTVFNVEQCEGLPAALSADRTPRLDFHPIAECERIVASLPTSSAPIRHVGNQACYVPAADEVRMPLQDRFTSEPDYYSVLFHELTHSTGHASRLNRPGITGPIRFGSSSYSREELIAEMGAAFLCGQAGIEVPALQQNQAAYIASWLSKLRGDVKLVVEAAAAAQKAADWLLQAGRTDETEDATAEQAACT